jgi:hypothetical protein
MLQRLARLARTRRRPSLGARRGPNGEDHDETPTVPLRLTDSWITRVGFGFDDGGANGAAGWAQTIDRCRSLPPPHLASTGPILPAPTASATRGGGGKALAIPAAGVRLHRWPAGKARRNTSAASGWTVPGARRRFPSSWLASALDLLQLHPATVGWHPDRRVLGRAPRPSARGRSAPPACQSWRVESRRPSGSVTWTPCSRRSR